MQDRVFWPLFWSFLLVAPPAEGAVSAALERSEIKRLEQTSHRHKDKKKAGLKKESKKKTQQQKKSAAPAWKWSRKAPYTAFLWLARQFPDFTRFPSATREIRLSIVAHRKKALLFLDSCLAKPKGKSWQVTKCNAISLDSKELLGRLVKGGTDPSASPDSLQTLKKFIASLRKTDRKKELLPLLMESSIKNKEGYRLLDDIESDLKECGRNDYFKALGSLPKPAFVGSNVVVVDLQYKVERGASSYQLKASLAKTEQGWRIGGLQIHCY